MKVAGQRTANKTARPGYQYQIVLGRAIGLPTDFSGPMAKPQRMAVLTAAALLSLAEPLWSGQGGLLAAALWLVALGAALTALRRSLRMIRALDRRG